MASIGFRSPALAGNSEGKIRIKSLPKPTKGHQTVVMHEYIRLYRTCTSVRAGAAAGAGRASALPLLPLSYSFPDMNNNKNNR